MTTFKRLFLLVPFLLVFLLPGSAQAVTAAPGWQVTAVSYPTNMSPGGTGFMRIHVFNTGAASSTAGATLTDTLPPRIRAQSGAGWTCSSGMPQTCTTSVPVLPEVNVGVFGEKAMYHSIAHFSLPVTVLADAQGSEENRVTVAGGGAPAPASVSDAIAISSSPAGFGIADWAGWFSNADGTIDTQAGSHPYEATFVLALNAIEGSNQAENAGGELRSVDEDLPAGMVANPNAAAQCTHEKFESPTGYAECPAASQIGVATIGLSISAEGPIELAFPVYNLVPPPGVPAQFGFNFEGVDTFVDGSVRSGSDYGLSGNVDHISQRQVLQAIVTLWGVPAESSHDSERCAEDDVCDLSSEAQAEPFLTMPTSCTGKPLTTTVSVREWQDVSAPRQSASFQTPPVTGCEQLTFSPRIGLAPETSYTDTPTGLAVEVKVPQEGLNSPEGLSTADIKNTTVTLPEGLVINPGQAAGLAACGPGEDALTTEREKEEGKENTGPPSCPKASKVGEVSIKTPLLEQAFEKELKGDVYVLQSDPPNLKLLLAASGDGVNLKLVGDVHLNEATGQLTTTFTETPELPFTVFKLTFSGGAQAALATPTTCSAYTTNADFTPWSTPFTTDQLTGSFFNITSSAGGGACPTSPLPFSPTLSAGATTDQAGGFTDFSLLLQRGDDQQRIDGLQFKAPEGLTGELASVSLCTNAQAEANACPAASKIGHTVVESGPGSSPLVVPEPGQEPAPIYLTGPYNGSGACTPGESGCAPFGLSIVVPLHVGPFVLPTQRVRAKIELNPLTAALTVTTNPLPQEVAGVPTDLREVDSVIERPEFMINPTNCDPSEFSGTAYGTPPRGQNGPNTAAAIGSHFQVGSCQALKFEPKVSVSTSGKTSKADGASLTYRIAYPNVPQGTDADIRYAKVELPSELPSRLTTLQKACTAQVFDANPAGCPAPSVIGHALVHTQLLPVPLEGPVYFVSNGGEAFPNLEMVLQGDGVTVQLIGDTLIKNGVTSTTFKAVPDQPFQTFEIKLPEGPYSALAANGNLCKPTVTKVVKKRAKVRTHGRTETITQKLKEQVATSLQMPSEYIGQNNARYSANAPIKVEGCPKVKPAKKKRASAKRRGRK